MIYFSPLFVFFSFSLLSLFCHYFCFHSLSVSSHPSFRFPLFSLFFLFAPLSNFPHFICFFCFSPSPSLPPSLPLSQGFKHKVFLVQVAAYSAWKVLINNFSLEMDRLTQQRRLKLLLMPLLASAVKDKHEQVETARLLTWWHLIKKLGPHRESLFQQVYNIDCESMKYYTYSCSQGSPCTVLLAV